MSYDSEVGRTLWLSAVQGQKPVYMYQQSQYTFFGFITQNIMCSRRKKQASYITAKSVDYCSHGDDAMLDEKLAKLHVYALTRKKCQSK